MIPKNNFTNPIHSIGSSVFSIVIGLFAGFIILLLSNASQALNGILSILTSGFSSMNNLGQVLFFASPIIMTGLSVAFSAKTGLFNIGAAGQFIIGAYAAVLVGVKCDFLPGYLHLTAALFSAFIAGALWGMIPGLLKAFFNVHEVISCIMTNYIGIYLVNFLVTATVFDSSRNQSLQVTDSAVLPKMGMDKVFKDGFLVSSVNSGIIIAVVFAVIAYVIIKKTVFGYELRTCGLNREAARFAGINEKRCIISSFVISGALAGLGGALLYLSGQGKGIPVVDVLTQEGFNGIPVALLALNNPLGIIFSGFLIAYLKVGGLHMQIYNLSSEIIEIIIAVIIYFSAFAIIAGDLINYIRKRMRNNL